MGSNLTKINPFSEYAFLVESEDYPKSEITLFQLKGKMDTLAFAGAYEEALAQYPIFSCHLMERFEGFGFQPYWVHDEEVPNRLHVQDCRHMAPDPFDIVKFTDDFFAVDIRRKINLTNEFPFNSYLLRVSEDDWVFAVLFNHSVVDPIKALGLLTSLFVKYHEKVKGETPKWAEAPASGMHARKAGNYVKPLPFTTFAKEQLADAFGENRKSRMSHIYGENLQDYRKVKGRNNIRFVIEDMDFIQSLVDRAINLGGTFNDLLLAVGRKVLSDWNKEHGASAERFRMMLAVSLFGRTKLPDNVGAGLAALNNVSAGHQDADLDTLIKFYRDRRIDQLTRGVDIRYFQLLTKLVSAMRIFPLSMRTSMLRPILQNIPVTFTLSNLGSLWPKEIFPDGRQSLESRIVESGDIKLVGLHSSISLAPNVEMLMNVRTHNKKCYINIVSDKFRLSGEESTEIAQRIMKEMENAV